MAKHLKQSTAATVHVGPFVDKADGLTPETGLAAGTVDEIGVYKHAGTSLTDISGTTTFTHRAGGMYTATLSTDDTDTIGHLRLYVRDDDVCLPHWEDFEVLAANVYDSIYGAATDKLQVDQVELGSSSQSSTDLKDFADTGYDPSTHKVAGVVLVDTTTTNTDMRGTDSALTDKTGFSLAADQSGVTIGTTTAVTNGVNIATGQTIAALTITTLTVTNNAIAWNSNWDAEVQSEVHDEMILLGLDHLLSASVTGTDITDNSVIAKMVSKSATADWDSYVNTTDSLEALRDRGDAAWITATTVDLNADQSSVTIGTVTTNTDMRGTDGANTTTPPTAAAIADAVWDEAISGHTTSTAFGGQLQNIDGKTVPAALQIIAAMVGGKVSGAGTGTEVFVGLDASTTRVTATVDSSGNRSAMSYS